MQITILYTAFRQAKRRKKKRHYTHIHKQASYFIFFASFLSLNEEIRRKKKTEWHKSTTDDSCLHFDSVKIEKEENEQRKKERKKKYLHK